MLIEDIETFGKQLLATGDLDPLYIALTGAELESNQLRRFLFAYWCCYNAGASSWLSELEGMTYWTWMRIMAENSVETPLKGRWPRGHERRHFRGDKAVKAVEYFAKQNDTPEQLVVWLEQAAPSFQNVRRRVMTLPQFGPWIAFKVADMLERVMFVPINFDNADVMMFEQPYNSALEVYPSLAGGTGPGWTGYEKKPLSETAIVEWTAKILISRFNQFLAPPLRSNNRPVNIQEVETILCKWKSHRNGSYPMGLDSRELRHGLTEWAQVSKTAERLFDAAPKVA